MNATRVYFACAIKITLVAVLRSSSYMCSTVHNVQWDGCFLTVTVLIIQKIANVNKTS